jgi:hypothetical protein
MVDVRHLKCAQPGCKKRPNYNDPDKIGGRFCNGHKQVGMVDVTHRVCSEPGCRTRPCFNHPDELVGVKCDNHKETGMINVVDILCSEPGCETRPTFNHPGYNTPDKCLNHKEPGMVDVANKKCSEPGCQKHPHFNHKDEVIGVKCDDHKEPGMINVVDKRCSEPGCTKHPHFNFPDEIGGVKCGDHKEDGMIDVKHIRCSEPGCSKRPNFNYSNQIIPDKCFDHKKPTMMDITHKLCSEPNCLIRATYGRINGPKEHCDAHRNANEYKRNHPKCATLGCTNDPMYTDKGDNYPRRCEGHRLPQDKNVIERPCAKCQLPNYINETTLMCNACSDFFIKKRDKVKEQRVVTLIESNGFKPESTDRKVEGGCTLYRPDILLDFQLFETDVEIDENQHDSYPPECEIIRMIMLHQDFGGKPVVFLRFNPDTYQSPVKCVDYKGRERILLDLLNSFRNVKEIKYPLLVCYLFYDGFDGKIQFKSLDPITRQMIDVSNVFV